MSYEYKGSDALIWQPNTNVRSFPSGLLQVTRTAIVRRTGLAAARQQVQEGDPLPCDAPAIDGVYIFPTAEERDLGNGFYEFVVTGYARGNTSGRQWQISTFFTYQSFGTQLSTLKVDLQNKEFCLPAGSEITQPPPFIFQTTAYEYIINTNVSFNDYGRFIEVLQSETLNVLRTTPATP